MSTVDALLVNPISARMIPAFVPHGLLCIASCAIKCNYSIEIYDRNVEKRAIVEILKQTNPKVVGIGCLTGTAIIDAIYVSKEIRKMNPSIKIVWGGVHPTLCPDSVLKQDFVDFVVLGDGEAAFARILDNVVNSETSLDSIDNLGYKVEGQIKYNKRSFVNLDNMPLPAWHLVNVEKYIRKKFYANRVLAINTSRGCPYECTFCCVPAVHQGRWRAMHPEKIFEHLKYLKEKYHIDGFQADDDEFDIDKLRVLKLCDLLQLNNMNLKWSHYSRVDILKEDILKREIECGLKLIEFGVESGSARMLKFLKKNQTLEQIFDAYNICQRLNVKTSALFMIGLPTEEVFDLIETVKMVKHLKSHMTICTLYRPCPGTELFNYCIDKGLFPYEDSLEKAGRLYQRTINTSNIKTELLLKIKRYFDRRNIYQEIKFILTRLKIGLALYYFIYYVLKPKAMCFKETSEKVS